MFSYTVKKYLLFSVVLLFTIGLSQCGPQSENKSATASPQSTGSETVGSTTSTGGNESGTSLSTAVAQVAREAIPGVVYVHIKEVQEVANPMYNFEQDPFFHYFFGNPNTPKKFKRELQGLGSGIIFDTKGHVLTNYHVVAGADEIKVSLAGGEEYTGKVVGTDPKTDLAVIEIPAGENLPALHFGNSDNMAVGDWVVAIGSPEGLYQTVTQGIISAKHRRGITEPNSYQDYLQTDAAINPGNSGGPLLNLKGEVIGVNSAIMSQSGGFEGLGFAIPSNIAVHIAGQLIEHGKVERGWLGVSIRNLTPDTAKSSGLNNTNGVIVAEVVQGGPADEAGIKQGDIITGYRGQEITDASGLRDAVANTPIGQEVKVTVMRNGKSQQFTVKIGDLHQAMERLTASLRKQLGARVGPVPPEDTQKYQLHPGEGVIIRSVQPDGVLGKAGFEVGDIILGINDQPVTGVDSYVSLVESLKPHQQVVLVVLDHRTGQTGTIRITMQ